MTGEYLTPEDVAELLQVSPKTVSRWSLEDATMPALRRGRVLRFRRDALMAWLQRHEQGNRGRSHRADHARITQAAVADDSAAPLAG
jgi:excisionase family DNA binding protein